MSKALPEYARPGTQLIDALDAMVKNLEWNNANEDLNRKYGRAQRVANTWKRVRPEVVGLLHAGNYLNHEAEVWSQAKRSFTNGMLVGGLLAVVGFLFSLLVLP